MFTAALFTIAKIWKCPSIDNWIKKTVVHIYIYNGILLGHEKNKLLPFATVWIDLEGIMFSEISQSEKDKYGMISLTCKT